MEEQFHSQISQAPWRLDLVYSENNRVLSIILQLIQCTCSVSIEVVASTLPARWRESGGRAFHLDGFWKLDLAFMLYPVLDISEKSWELKTARAMMTY